MFFEIPLELSEIVQDGLKLQGLFILPDIPSSKLSEFEYMLSIRVLDEEVILVGSMIVRN